VHYDVNPDAGALIVIPSPAAAPRFSTRCWTTRAITQERHHYAAAPITPPMMMIQIQ
jgi:hypothetical protein